MGKECNNEVPSPITSSGNMMSVIFFSDYSVNMKGFSANWKMVEPSAAVTYGEVKSPNYPQNYPNNLKSMEYIIKVAIRKKVNLTIEDLAIEDCAYCACDKLEIYDTPPTDAPTLLDTLCRSTLPSSSYISTSNILTLYLTTDENINDKGFKASWKDVN